MFARLNQNYRHEGVVFGQLGGWPAEVHTEVPEPVRLLTVFAAGLALTEHRLQLGFLTGQDQSTGDDARLVHRTAVSADWYWKTTWVKSAVKWNDWGPYDYHRTFNLTFPFQALLDVSTGMRGFVIEDPGTRLGLRTKYRTFDEHSPDPLTFSNDGYQFEVFSYLSFAM